MREGNVDERGAGLRHGRQRVLEGGVGVRAEALEVSRHTDARAAKPVGVEELRVVRRDQVAVGGGRGVARVRRPLRDRCEHRGRVGDRAGVRAHRVLRVADRDHSAPACQADRGLDADDAVHARRAHDAAVGLTADADGAEVRRCCRAAAGARAARVAVERVGVVALASPSRPAAGGEERAEVRPLAEGRLAQDHRAGGAEVGRDRGVVRRG